MKHLLISGLFAGNAVVFGVLNYQVYVKPSVETAGVLEKKDPVVKKIQYNTVVNKRTIERKKIISIIEENKVLEKMVKEVLKTNEIPSPVPIMIRRENILEEKPAVMPVWVVQFKQPDEKFIYFIGTRTKALDSETALSDAKKIAQEEVFKYIGIKMDYEMRIEKISEKTEYDEDIQEQTYKEIQSSVLGNISGIDEIVKQNAFYFRKVKEPDGNFYEGHILIACDKDKMTRAIQESIDKTLGEVRSKSDIAEGVKKEKERILNNLKAKKNELIFLNEKEKQAYEMKRKSYETIEKAKGMSDLSFKVFLGEKYLFFQDEKEAKKILNEAYREIETRARNLQEIIEVEESVYDGLETKIKKRIKRADMYFRKGNYVGGYDVNLSALEALLSDYDKFKAKGILNTYLNQIDERLFKYLEKLPSTRYEDFDSDNGKIIFKGKGKGNIYAFFNNAGQLLCTKMSEEEGTVYAFYSGDRIIYKMMKMKDEKKQGESVRNFALYDEKQNFIKVIK